MNEPRRRTEKTFLLSARELLGCNSRNNNTIDESSFDDAMEFTASVPSSVTWPHGPSFVVAGLLFAISVALAVDLGSARLGSLDEKFNWVADDVCCDSVSNYTSRRDNQTFLVIHAFLASSKAFYQRNWFVSAENSRKTILGQPLARSAKLQRRSLVFATFLRDRTLSSAFHRLPMQ